MNRNSAWHSCVEPTCVSPEVRLQVRALGICLPTAGESAGVCGCAFPRPGPATSFWLGVHHFQRGRRWSEQDPLAGRWLLLHAHGRVFSKHTGELVMVVRPGERKLNPGVRVRKSRGCAAMVRVEALRECQRGGVAHLLLVAL